MNNELIIPALLIALCVILVLLPPRFDPAIRIKEALSPELTDADKINRNICPDCGSHETLYTGPSGGMSQNIACSNCLMEFNVGFGFGTGAFMVDRTGKLTRGRGKMAFGFGDAEFGAEQ